MTDAIKTREGIIRKALCLLVYSFIAAFMFVAGKAYDTSDVVSLVSGAFLLHYLTAVVIIALFSASVYLIKEFLRSKNIAFPLLYKLKKPSKKIRVILPGTCYIISLLSIIPGIFSYDCWQEWQMMETGKLTAHHPVLHVLLAGGLAKLSNDIFASANPGIVLYVLLQISFLLWVIARVFDFMNERGSRPVYQWLALLFFSFSPMINLYSLVVSKDGLFAIFELLFILETVKAYLNESYFRQKKNTAIFIFASLGTMIFRNNGLYVVIVVLVCMLMILKGRRKQLILPLAIIAAVYVVYTGPFYKLLNVEAASKRELLSIPIQQLGRVNRFNPEDLSQEDLEIMHSVIKAESWELYIPTCADAIKNGFIDEGFEAHKGDFIKLWLRQGIRHPMAYINAFMTNTVDFWYPFAVNDSYGWLYGKDPDMGDFLDYRAAEPCREIAVFGKLHEAYYFISTDLEITAKPLAAIFLNPGVYLLIWLTVMFYDIAKKNGKRLTVHITLLLTVATIFLGPMVQVRYLVILYYVFPIWLVKLNKG